MTLPLVMKSGEKFWYSNYCQVGTSFEKEKRGWVLDLTRSRNQVGGRTPANVFSAGGFGWLSCWLAT